MRAGRTAGGSKDAKLFVAIGLEDSMRLHLCGLPLTHIPRTEHIDDKDYHITLNFIGVESVHKVHDALKQVKLEQVEQFEVEVRGVGAFPNSALPLTLWAGLEQSVQLMELQASLSATLKANGVAVSERATYTPHITLARVVKSARGVAAAREFLQRNERFEAGKLRVREVLLMETVVGRATAKTVAAAPRYAVRERYALGRRQQQQQQQQQQQCWSRAHAGAASGAV
ncbi:unnamed protein product [Agarophyton chilense]